MRDVVDPTLAVWGSLPPAGERVPDLATELPGVGEWPGVDDPDALRAHLADWLTSYGNAGTRRTYAYALGLPIPWVDTLVPAASTPSTSPAGQAPPPALRGPLYGLAWLRWCARRQLDPRAATGRDVTAWVHELEAGGAGRRTRERMLATVSALYGHLTAIGAVAGNPATLNRRRLGLAGSARDASPTVKLTAANLHALLVAAADLPPTVIHRHRRLYATRAVAFVALLTLGFAISELTGLDRGDRYVSGGEEVLRVLGKGGHDREVYTTDLVGAALDEYLAERDRVTGAPVPAQRGRTAAGASPLIATAAGRRCTRTYLYELLRKIAEQARPLLGDELAARVHPHAVRHAYITIALEKGAHIHHVQDDAGHATIATTQHYNHGRRTRDTSAADLVAAAITAAGET